jgi:hypothetical protein
MAHREASDLEQLVCFGFTKEGAHVFLLVISDIAAMI